MLDIVSICVNLIKRWQSILSEKITDSNKPTPYNICDYYFKYSFSDKYNRLLINKISVTLPKRFKQYPYHKLRSFRQQIRPQIESSTIKPLEIIKPKERKNNILVNIAVNILTFILSIIVLIVIIFVPPILVEMRFGNSIITTLVSFFYIILSIALGNEISQSAKKRRFEKKQIAFEKEQIAKGLVKFVDRFKNEKWGAPDEVEMWRKEDDEARVKESLFSRVIESIKKFEPSNKWSTEEGYHGELIGDLKRQFPNVKAEHQTGSSRPDIVIDNIAIEVKGPTDTHALTTLADKIYRYSNHYHHIIFVLFKPCFSEPRYDELIKGIREKHPNVQVIRKDSCEKQHEPDNSPSSPVPTPYPAINPEPEKVIAKPSASVSLQELRDELAKINKLREELEETFINGEITEAKYKELVEKYRVEADALKNQIAKKKFM